MDTLALKSQWRKEQAELKQKIIVNDNVGWVTGLKLCNDAIIEVRYL